MFSQLLDRGCFCDVTLACEGQTLKAHRVVLCACSTYFDSILTNGCSDKDPIVIMKDCKFADIKCLIEFMYKGEINVEHVSNQLSTNILMTNKKYCTSTIISSICSIYLSAGSIIVTVENCRRPSDKRFGRSVMA